MTTEVEAEIARITKVREVFYKGKLKAKTVWWKTASDKVGLYSKSVPINSRKELSDDVFWDGLFEDIPLNFCEGIDEPGWNMFANSTDEIIEIAAESFA